MIRVLSTVCVALLGIFLFACGGSSDDPATTPVPQLPDSTPTSPPVSGTPNPVPTELRVAFINLGSPITIDEDDRVAEETFLARLEIVVAELKEFRPDIVAVTDVTWTAELGTSARDVLASGLRWESQYQRANPWYPGQDKEASDATRDLVGFEEGEAVFSRYPILGSQRIPLNPRTSENIGRIALHAVVKIEPYGEVNVYVSRLSGTTETREAQAASLRSAVEETHEGRPSLIFADIGLEPETQAVTMFTETRYFDLASAADEGEPLGTCCRAGMLFNVPEEPPPNGETEAPAPAEEVPEEDLEDSPTPVPEDEEVAERRTLYVFSDVWNAERFRIFGHRPSVRADDSRLYASDHNGVFAVIPLSMAGQETPLD